MMNTVTPYILFGMGLVVSLQTWLVIRSFRAETQHELLRQAFEIYVENAGKGAAVILNRPNPVPEHIQPLLKAHIDGTLTDPNERKELLDWAKSVATDRTQPRDERGVAYALAAAVGATDHLNATTRHWWKLWM